MTAALGGGHRSAVWAATDGRRRLVVHRSGRTTAALDWELDLTAELLAHGFRVPGVVPTADGRRRCGPVVVRTWLDGDPPGPRDEAVLAAELRRLHALTSGRAQRPGFVGTVELLAGAVRGGDVDLTAMPRAVVARCKAAWAVLDGPVAVVHGDPGPGNVRMLGGRPGLLDWDECRVDRVALDLDGAPGATPALRRAVAAWEVAAGWTVEPGHARERLAALRAGP
ncbi:phosphotransferase enzyme family protein [Pseudonocardia sp. ICBG1293]|uniref:phosphotransferase enzyme family protein n=1 Tax=Pseudonocardia sp. ICBG1293 TaxID=2844382 RepID=UPI001CCFF618|nr:phosphotransferase [Pseudonocardia sp. ICBG1293]